MFSVFLPPSEFQIEKNKVIATDLSFGTEWSLSFDLKYLSNTTSAPPNAHHSILQLEHTNEEDGDCQQYPALFVRKSKKHQLQFCYCDLDPKQKECTRTVGSGRGGSRAVFLPILYDFEPVKMFFVIF